MGANLLNEVESPGKRKEILTGQITTTTSGTISAAAGTNTCEGFTVTRTAAGRYVAALAKGYRDISYAHAVVEGSAAAAAAAAKGQVCELRSVSGSGKTCTLQFLTPSLAAGASVDVDVEDGALIRFIIVARRGTI